MSQSALIFDAPPAPAYTVAQARAAGERAGNKAADKAESQAPGFCEAAEAFVLGYLQQHGPTSGEVITDAAKLAGIRPREDRAFGPVYGTLARQGRIKCAGFCIRRKGRGTAGGRVWALA